MSSLTLTAPQLNSIAQFDSIAQPHSYANWIHLDMKGMMPSQARLGEWLEWLAGRGFGGVVFEYEDRLPWQTFPGTFRRGFDLDDWERIWKHCAQIGLQVTPLIQTYGHLEWLLKHNCWSHLRCDGHLNLICPQNSEVRVLLKQWIAEVARLHPDSDYMHVGLDEVYHMAGCPQCRELAAQSPRGELEVFLEHAAFVCETVIQNGKRPIIWADMLIEKGGIQLADKLPPETVLCDWNYQGEVGKHTPYISGQSEREIMGASAIRRSYWTHFLMTSLPARIENVTRWHDRISRGEAGPVSTLIHTVWSRSRGLSPLYGPWEGWLPAFLQAAEPENALSPLLCHGMELLERGHQAHSYEQAHGASCEMAKLHSDDAMEEAALRWWELSLRHCAELFAVQYYTLSYEALRSAVQHQGADPDLVDEIYDGRAQLQKRLAVLRDDINAFLQRHQWSDADEYLCSRIDNITRVLGLLPYIAIYR